MNARDAAGLAVTFAVTAMAAGGGGGGLLSPLLIVVLRSVTVCDRGCTVRGRGCNRA